MKAVHTELHRSHDPQFFLVRGVVKRTTEQPERADRLLKGLKDGKHQLVEPTTFGQGPRARIHSPEYLSFLSEAWDAWTALGDSGPEMIGPSTPRFSTQVDFISSLLRQGRGNLTTSAMTSSTRKPRRAGTRTSSRPI